MYCLAPPDTLDEVKDRITNEIRNIPPLMIKKVIKKMRDRAMQCVFRMGGGFEGKKRQ